MLLLNIIIIIISSSKFSKKLVYVKSLADLNKVLSSQDLQIPEEVVEWGWSSIFIHIYFNNHLKLFSLLIV